MMQPIVRIFQFILFVGLLGTATIASAQEDIMSRGIEVFRETCLMADARSEKIYQWATEKNLKIVAGQGPDRAGLKILTWEVARSGAASLRLQAFINDPGSLNCTVYFDGQRDTGKQVETFFLEEMKRRPRARRLSPGMGPDSTAYSFAEGTDIYGYLDGRQNEQDKPHIWLAVFAHLAPSDAAVSRSFATPERSYRLFVNSCLAHFPDIESIGEYVAQDLGWKSPTAVQTKPFYSGLWSLWDPFDEFGPYTLELRHTQAYKSCALHFDLRAGLPLERLIHDYALVHAGAPSPGFPPRQGEKTEYYSGLVGGTQATFMLVMQEAIHDGELNIYVEPPQ
jgi:hypothetical protein